MYTPGIIQSKTHLKTLFWGFAIVFFASLMILAILGFYFRITLSESQGIFHVKTSVADVNGDGKLDVILHSVREESEFTAFGGITLWVNRGEGKFINQGFSDVQSGGWASAVGDVDGDGDADLVVFPGYSLFFILNQGGAQGGKVGEFKDLNSVNPPANARENQFGSIILGDLNNDGQLDGIVTGCCGRSFPASDQSIPNMSWVWRNAWARIGRPASDGLKLQALNNRPVAAAALGDLDGDGSLDLFAATLKSKAGGGSVPGGRVLFNDGAGNFRDSGQQLGQTDTTAVTLGDLDCDGDFDALVGTSLRANAWINQGGAQGGQKGSFAISPQVFFAGPITAVFLSDLDGDGDMDAVLSETQHASIWWNDGHAAFSPSNQEFKYSERQGLAVEDFNGDGRPDVFVGDGSSKYQVWFNQGDEVFR